MKKVAVVRGAFLNRYEMQWFESLTATYDITAFASHQPFHDQFTFPVIKMWSPYDWRHFPYGLSVLNRMFVDAHYLYGLENALQGFDLVHTAETYFHYTQQALNAKQQGRVKHVIATVLENIPHNNEGIRGRQVFKQRARSELDHVIALTERTKATLLLEGMSEEKISILSHFIDTKRFHLAKLSQREAFTYLFVGRLEYEKGITTVLNGFAYLSNVLLPHTHLRLRIVGDGSLRKKVEFFIQDLGISKSVSLEQVSYDAMPELFRQADVFVAPSIPIATWHEQYNTSLLEAQASGLPIITTGSGGISENVGDAGIYIFPDDWYGLAREMHLLYEQPNLRMELAKRARQRAETKHDATIGAEKLAMIYEKVMSNGS